MADYSVSTTLDATPFEAGSRRAIRASQEMNRQMEMLLQNVQRIEKALGTSFANFKPPKFTVDKEMQKAQADIARYNQAQKKFEQEMTRQVAKEAEAQYQAKVKQWQRGLQEFEKILNKQNNAAKESSSLFSSFFGASFFGNLASNIVSSFIGVLSSILEKVGEIWDEAVKISSERQNALAGLQSASVFKGISPEEVQKAVTGLRLVKAGILDISSASTAMKNLLSSNFTLQQSVDILERFSDSAAFGKQAALDYNEAISRATEGIKNQNSNLVDNVGLTKNLSVILKERGFELQDLTDKQKSHNALLALYSGIMTETAGQVGDADVLTKNYTGSVASLNTAYSNLLAVLGDYTTKNPEMVLANRILTEQIEGYTKAVGDANSETGQFVRDAVKDYAYLKALSIIFIDYF